MTLTLLFIFLLLFFLTLLLKKIIFIWLCRALVAACGIFSCRLWTLSCICDRFSDQGLNRAPCTGVQILSHWTTGEVPIRLYCGGSCSWLSYQRAVSLRADALLSCPSNTLQGRAQYSHSRFSVVVFEFNWNVFFGSFSLQGREALNN